MYPVTLWTSPLSIYELLAVEPEFTCWIIKVSFLGYRKEFYAKIMKEVENNIATFQENKNIHLSL